jgi:hypothetical protein
VYQHHFATSFSAPKVEKDEFDDNPYCSIGNI